MTISLHLAVSGGVQLLEENAAQALASAKAWNELWVNIFTQTSGLWLAVNFIASIVVAVSFLGFSLHLIEQVVNRNAIPTLRHYLWLLLAMMLLTNDGKMLADTTITMRNVTGGLTQSIFKIQIADTSIDEAIQDVLVTNDIQDWLKVQYRACEIKTGEAQLKCLEDVSARARDLIDEAESRYGPLAGLARLWERINDFKPAYFGVGDNPMVGILIGSAAQSTVRWVLKGWQWAFSNILELAMIITGIYGPIAVAASTLPLAVRPLWAWFIGYLGLSLALWSYVVIIGLIAQVIVLSQMQEASDIGFLILLGIGAPFLAGALARAGGMAVLQAMGSGASMAASIGTRFIP